MNTHRSGPVLVVDDHPMNRLLLEHVLQLERIDVLGASSMAEADQILHEIVPPVIVLDLQLPDGHGFEFVRRLKANPRTSSCAVVACTAADILEEEQEALEAGCSAYVTKPIDTRSFAELVGSLLVWGALQPAVS